MTKKQEALFSLLMYKLVDLEKKSKYQNSNNKSLEDKINQPDFEFWRSKWGRKINIKKL